MKAVFDTNILVAAFVTEGICGKLLLRGRKKQFNLILCPFILDEFKTVLIRKFSASPKEAQEASDLVAEAAQLVADPGKIVSGVCRDANDDAVLACALAGKTEVLVTGDKNLLILREHQRTRIISPRDFESLFSD